MERPNHESDAEFINRGIAEALELEQAIGHDTATAIAYQLHGGQWSGLYSFASSGHFDADRLADELRDTYEDEEAQAWQSALLEYVQARRRHEQDDPRVYCQPLAAYNNGRLCGRWLIAAVEAEELWEGVRETLAASPEPNEEEFGWFDHDNFEGIQIPEYMSVEHVSALGRLVAEHGRAFGVFYNYDTSIDLDTAGEAFEEAYIGEMTEAELADQLLEDAIEEVQPEWIRPYIDGEKYVHDLSCNGDVYEGEGHWFWTR